MSSRNFSSAKQNVKPPQRGIFPLDHDSECKPFMEKYIACLQEHQDRHHLCRDLSKDYLQCRMDRKLMADEDLDKLGFSEDAKVEKAEEYDKSKEREGYVAGKHIDGRLKWWFQR
mmetsp:Transcript_12620/g.27632  ORF Transcript_12620/g.27632 Transcript_12620/m.27632 type:complete len:115 (-) Transcript_12620:337-681(-)|eukprot:g2605.t1 g2605   contig12:444019-444603(+)